MEKNGFTGYEYRDVTVKRSMASMMIDCYESFGWEVAGTGDTVDAVPAVDKMVIKFKRDRKIRNKAELIRLQHLFDACVSDIEALEKSRFLKASVVAYGIGLIGTAFLVGSVFCASSGMILPCVGLAVPALVGWILPALLYKRVLRKKTEEVTPIIEKKYDDLYSVCERAYALLDIAD